MHKRSSTKRLPTKCLTTKRLLRKRQQKKYYDLQKWPKICTES